MRRFVLCAAVIAFVFPFISDAQNPDDQDAVMRLAGCVDPELLDPEEAERLNDYLIRPLKINLSSESEISSSGLFTEYQVVSLLDYIRRHGSVMSFAELAAIDGFSPGNVELSRPFLDLSYNDEGVMPSGFHTYNDLCVRYSVRTDDDLKSSYALKYRLRHRDRLIVSLAASSPTVPGMGPPEVYSGHISWKLHKRPVYFAAGDVNLRFGQGLALWSGMSLSGASSIASFRRNGTGVSGVWSYTGSSAKTGLTAEVRTRKYRLSAFVCLPGIKSVKKFMNAPALMPGVAMSYYLKNTQFFMIHYMIMDGLTPDRFSIPDMKTSAGLSSCYRGADISAEVVYDWVNSTVAGLFTAIFPVSGQTKLALNARCYPSGYNPSFSAAVRSGTKCSNEYGFAVCSQSSMNRHDITASSDIAYYPEPKGEGDVSSQVRLFLNWDYEMSATWFLSTRLTERLRTWGQRSRADFRVDVRWEPSCFSMNARFNYLYGRSHAFLGYMEGGYKDAILSSFLRIGIYKTKYWDDRIYVYERDAPGSFNVPFFYDKGLWISAVLSWKYSKWGKLYLSLEKRKPGKAELKLQGVFSF